MLGTHLEEEKYFKTKKYVTYDHPHYIMDLCYEFLMNTNNKQFILYHNISIFLHK